MKETMQQHLHTVGQKAIQNVIRHEYGDWPPKSGGFYYQPHRPEKKPAAAQPQTHKRQLYAQYFNRQGIALNARISAHL